MKYRKIMFMLVLAIFIFGAASVCASDMNDTVIASEDTGQTELSAGNENEIVEQASNEEVISEANAGTFQELQQNITQGYGSYITLDKDYEYEDGFSTDGITITQSIIIDGQGHKIDAKGKARIFNIKTDNVILQNITFMNGKSTDGGAIKWEANRGSVLNCHFENNTATGDGGAIHWENRGKAPSVNLNVIRGCSFVNNTANQFNHVGGAICFDGEKYTATVEDCNFKGNSAPSGGAVYFLDGYDTATVTNCNFTGNTATYYGGAVEFDGTGNVTNCNFTGNTASRDGGAVYFYQGTGTVSNCNFINNNATANGGAVYFNGNGEVTNCNFTNNTATGTGNYDGGGAVYFYKGTGSVTNCNFTGNTASREGGAIRFSGSGTVSNCNFTGNTADKGGAVFFLNTGNVSNCNFVDNTANSDCGAISFGGSGTVTNCNFTNNKATGTDSWGGAILMFSGTVTNCNFTGNTATKSGGAIRMSSGSVSNCNFTGNNATAGSAIYFSTSATKTVSNSRFLNNRANAEALEITKNDNNITINFTGRNNLLNAIYSSNDAEVTFTNVTYWGAKGIATVSATMSGSNKAAGQNITVGVVVNGEIVLNQVNVTNEDGTIVLNINAGENYYITARHDTDSYYTEAEKAISNNTKFNVNVTSQTTNNKTVNITAKSNIPQDVVQGKLLFIVPNTDPINATYAGNGTWWALHEFNDAGDYNITALYTGLDNVTINNSTISIRFDTSLDVNNKTLDLLIGDQFTIVVTTTPDGLNVSYVADDSGVYSIDENGNVVALKEGKGVILIKVGGDGKYVESSTMVNVTVSKVPTEITLANDTLVLAISDTIDTGITLTPPNAGNVTYFISNSSVVKVEDGKIIALAEGKSTITVSFEGDKKYLAAENKTINVVVNRIKTELAANTITTTYNINKDLVITLKDSNGKALSGVKVSVDLNGAKIYTTDSNGQVKVSTNSLAPKTYTAKITFNGNTIYDKSAKDVKVTVKKATPKITAKKKTFKTSVKTKKYTITLKDNTGKPIKNAKVTLKVKGKTYKAKTNSKGKATFKITKLNKKGNYKATVTYKANKYYNKATKKVKIKVIITFKTVSKGSKDKSTVKEIQQALKDKGYYLSYKGHYLKVDGKFNSCTVRSIKEFQHDKGLKVTGKVDEKTAKKLGII